MKRERNAGLGIRKRPRIALRFIRATQEDNGMTLDEARRLALALPEAVESAHMGHPDFRVRNKIFASLPEASRVVVKLTPEQQEIMVGAEAEMFAPVKGGWGRQGWTSVILVAADATTMRSALVTAWKNVAPKRLVAEFEKG
jgi:hypothetical protein